MQIQLNTAKPARKVAATIAPATGPKFALSADIRPTRGAALAAHTLAALYVFGMLDNANVAVAKSALGAVIGERAVKYHVGLGNMARGIDTVCLTAAGLQHFRNQRTQDADRNAFDVYVAAMRGTPQDGIPQAKLVPLQ